MFVEQSLFLHLRPLNNVVSFSRYRINAPRDVPRIKGPRHTAYFEFLAPGADWLFKLALTD